MKPRLSLKSKIKFLFFVIALAKIVFLFINFLKKNPQTKNKLKNTVKTVSHFKPDTFKAFKTFKTFVKLLLIPHSANDHTPRALRPRALASYAAIIIIAKIFISSYLFFLYPTVLSAYTSIESEIIALTNQSRLESGVSALKLDSELERAAQAKAQDMVSQNYFAHFGPGEKKPWDWIDYSKYPYSIAGENLGKDFITAASVHRALMASATHRKNILNPKYRDLGIGLASGQIDGQETIVLVEFFGARLEPVSPFANFQTATDIKNNLQVVEQELFGSPKIIIPNQPQALDISQNIDQVYDQDIAAATLEVKARDWIQTVMQSFDLVAFVLLGFLVLALLLNIFIHLRIQKPKTIASALFVIAVILVFMFTNFHYFEGLARVISIK